MSRTGAPEISGFVAGNHVGGGGFADVYLYRQVNPSRQVAVKVLKQEHLNDQSLQQFRAEADIMAGVSQHPYIVSVFTAGVADDGRPYLVMEYYPRPHFGIRARGGSMPVAEVLKVGVQICSAVATAHESSILHRDIKPANILTSDYGHPGLTDFGIAGVREDGVLDTAEAVTIPYSPPEILDGSDATGSEITDVYSLAATIYAIVAGRPPHWVPGGDNSQGAMTARIINSKTVPRTGRTDVGPLDNLLALALSRDPAHRPQSALALAELLREMEIQLQLPPTPIEVRHQPEQSSGDPWSLGRTTDDHDGTRITPHVVHSQPGPLAARPAQPSSPPAPSVPPPTGLSSSPWAPSPSIPSHSEPSSPSPGQSRPPVPDVDSGLGAVTGAAVAPPTTARPTSNPQVAGLAPSNLAGSGSSGSGLAASTPGLIEQVDQANPLTRRRVTPIPTGPEPEDDQDLTGHLPTGSGFDPRSVPKPVIAVAAAIIMIIIAVTAVALMKSDGTPPATTIPVVADPPRPMTAMTVDPPSEVVVAWDPETHRMTVSWVEPSQADDIELTYRLVAKQENGSEAMIDQNVKAAFAGNGDVRGTSTTITLPASVTSPPCVSILAITSEQRASDLSAPVCPDPG